MNASLINSTSYDDIIGVASDEFDWPQRSGYTGTGPDTPDVPLRSVYKYMVDRNRW